jgi:hypothetical protein
MTRLIRAKARAWAPAALIVLVVLLAAGTIYNQLAINATNGQIKDQARNGQLSLNRTCRLLPITKKAYGDLLVRRVITPADYALVLSTADTVCP